MLLTANEPPGGFVETLKQGALAELAYLGGWWQVSVLKRTANGKFSVIADRYEAKHSVTGDKLRPAWQWTPGAPHWEQRTRQVGKKRP